MPLHIPSPPTAGIHIGPAYIHLYGLMYVIGITLAIWITRRRWRAAGGDPALVADVALWAVPAGIIGGRIYFDLTTPMDIPHVCCRSVCWRFPVPWARLSGPSPPLPAALCR